MSTLKANIDAYNAARKEKAPAEILIRQNGVIACSFVNSDDTQRLEPTDIVRALTAN